MNDSGDTMNKSPSPFFRWRPHPWHGLETGIEPPRRVQAFIEICPFDMVKYEVDKATGYLRVDRSVRSSSQHPTLYGFIPRTYCGDRVGNMMADASCGDGDPLDICVITERPISKTEIILNARVVGGIEPERKSKFEIFYVALFADKKGVALGFVLRRRFSVNRAIHNRPQAGISIPPGQIFAI